MTKTIYLKFFLCLLLLAPLFGVRAQIVISQVYGGGGNSGAPLKNDFVELFNRGTAAVSLSTYSVQYASAAGTGNLGAGNGKTDLSGTIQPGQYYLVQLAGGTTGADLPTADIIGTTGMSAAAGKVALVNSQDALPCNGGSTPCSAEDRAKILDLVGYGNANFFETAAAPGLSNSTSASRKASGCTDTDDNSADFTAGAPAPRNAATTLNPCSAGPLIAATPASLTGADELSYEVGSGSASKILSVSGSNFSTASGQITVTSSDAAFTVSPGTLSFSNSALATTNVTVTLAAGLSVGNYSGTISFSGGGANLAVSVSGKVVNSPNTITFIHDIQGSGATSPVTATTATIEGIVTRTFPGGTGLNGFYVQEEDADADADPATSEGIFVYDPAGTFTGSEGAKVKVTGTVAEFTTTSGGVSSSLTQLTDLNNVTQISSGNPLPAIVTVKLPVANVSDLERYEGMLVEVSATEGNLAVTDNFQLGRFGQVVLSATGASNAAGTDARLDQYTQFNTPSVSGYAAYLAEVAKRKIILDDGSSTGNPDPIIFGRGGQPLSATNPLRGGDEVASVTAVLDERFEGYRLQTNAGVNFIAANERPATPPTVGGTLKVGSFNLLNYFNGNGQGGGFPTDRGANTQIEYTRQRDKTIKAITESGVDIFAFNELENDGYDSNSAIQDLVSGANAVLGAGTFAFINPGVSISSDAITVGMIYKPAKVTPVGSAATLTTSAAFNSTGRQPLAQTFKENATNAEFTVVANHWKSKGSGTGAGNTDANDGQGRSNGTRTQQAQDLAAWLATMPTGTIDPDYLILGDLNAYAKEDPLVALENAGYTNLVPNTTYSYAFNGFFGALDHALGSASLVSQVTSATKWHINADEPIVLDYNTENKTPGQISSLYSADQYRTSDHDPVIVGLALTVPVTPLVISVSSTDLLCNGTATGSIDLTVSGGTPGYTFVWSNGAMTEDLSGLAAGQYMVTVMDNGGQSVQESVTITEPSAIAVTPGSDKSVILGFGSNCTDISASARGGTGTLTYLWQPVNLPGQSVEVCPTATTTYTVTVTDANNCTARATVKVTVNDVRCGNKNQNVTICYYGVTQCVSEKIAERYLKLGATIGGCGTNARIGAEEIVTEKPFSLSAQAFPNPTTGTLTLRIQSVMSGPAVLDVLDMAGKPLQQRVENLTEGLNEIPLDLDRQAAGTYLIRCRDAAGRQAVVRVHRQ
ncbi:ExeM/NucH family extracellular endonuclease [Persicitalea sp.]|uniref:ExeM/NucH family extracellular endonuclease n=1 Tax=Persicitalea sp. TaxID=3100273 RepID=UPI00359345E2